MHPTAPVITALNDGAQPSAPLTSAPSETPHCLGEPRVAELLGCSRRLLQKMRAKQSGPPYLRIGHARGRVVYPVAALREWIAVRTQMTQMT
jgi:predicted DNA-binding transcriptional regulator AlpA